VDEDAQAEPLVAVSAVEHYAYCPRQCALQYVDRVFEENVYTIRGAAVHERAHGASDTTEQGLRVLRALPIYSDRLGLVGQADVVEMRPEGPYPVEYKSGRIHRQAAELQLCAQALCLEEMYGVAVPRGAIYRAGARNRREVEFTPALRQRTEEVIGAVRALLRAQQLPPPVSDSRLCRHCSLADSCLPGVVRDAARLRGIQSTLFTVYDAETDEEV